MNPESQPTISSLTPQPDSKAPAGDYLIVVAGEGATAGVGAHGVAVAGIRGTAPAEPASAAEADEFGCAITGDLGRAEAGDDGTAIAGDYGAATSHSRGLARARIGSRVEVGNGGVALANEGSIVFAGTRSVACCLPSTHLSQGQTGEARAAQWGVAIVLIPDAGIAVAGDGGVIVLSYQDGDRIVLKVGHMKPDGPLIPGTRYRLDSLHDFEAV